MKKLGTIVSSYIRGEYYNLLRTLESQMRGTGAFETANALRQLADCVEKTGEIPRPEQWLDRGRPGT